jgi:hypothetical protein
MAANMTSTPKLGKRAPQFDPRTLQLAKYITPLPTPLPSIDWGLRIQNWPMYDNDTLGDCVCAAAGHFEQLWTADASTEVTLPVSDILTMYEQVGGYVPGQPDTDNGCNMLTALNWWKKSGLGGRKIDAFAAVNFDNPLLVKTAIEAFGGLYLGLALPLCVQGATSWSAPPNFAGKNAPGSWGGHCVPVIGYDSEGLTVVTWGSTLRMGWRFLTAYADEAFAIISPDWIEKGGKWIEKGGKAPSNLNLTQLYLDLDQI